MSLLICFSRHCPSGICIGRPKSFGSSKKGMQMEEGREGQRMPCRTGGFGKTCVCCNSMYYLVPGALTNDLRS